MGAYVSHDALSSKSEQLVESRFELSAQRVARTVQKAMGAGLSLSAQAALPSLLRRTQLHEPAILNLDVADLTNRILYSTDPTRVGTFVAPSSLSLLERPLVDDAGQIQGQVRVQYSPDTVSEVDRQLSSAVWQALWPAVLAACALTAVLGGWLTRLTLAVQVAATSGNVVSKAPAGAGLLRTGFRASMSLVSGLVLLVMLAGLNWKISQIAVQALTPLMQEKAQSVARASSSQIEYALETGVPLEQMQGLNDHFQSLMAVSPGIKSMSLRNSAGRVLSQRGPSTSDPAAWFAEEPLRVQGQTVGHVRVHADADVVSERLRDAALDTAFLAIVVLLMANELMALLGSVAISQHLIALDFQLIRQLQPMASDVVAGGNVAVAVVRPVLFTFMLAEELTRSFLPTYAIEMVPAGMGYSATWGSLPLVMFLATVALCQLPFAAVSYRMGHRTTLMWGAACAALGYGLSGWADHFWVFTVARLISGIGFALVFVSAQGAVIDGSDGLNRTRNLAVFVRAILVASLCGPPLGGLFADRWGVPAVFVISTVLCLLALGLAYSILPVPKQVKAREWELGLTGLPAAWRSARLRSLILGCGLPAKLMLATTCFYLVPIGLAQQGYSRSEIGRLMMIYPFLMVVAIPFFSAWAARLNAHRAFVIWGGMVAGACSLLAVWPLHTSSVALMLLMIGLGQAMSITSQTHMVVDLSQNIAGARSTSVLGFFRLIERGGSAVGPLTGAWLLTAVGLAPALMLTGGIVVAGSLAYAWTSRPVAGARA